MTDDRSPTARSLRQLVESALRAGGTATARWRPPPEFVVIGGKRCGSTSLYYGLLQHPAVIPMIPGSKLWPMREHRKGARWLDNPTGGPAAYRGHFVTAWARRRRAQAVGASATGEATPWYLFAPGAAETAARAAPEALYIAVLRDPVARAWSHFLEQRRRGHEPLADFGAALDAEDQRAAEGLTLPDGTSHSAAFALEHLTYRRQSEYHLGLATWFEHHPSDRFSIIASEDFYADVPATLASISAQLGLPAHEFTVERRNPTSKATLDAAVADRLRRHFRTHQGTLEEMLGRKMPWSLD